MPALKTGMGIAAMLLLIVPLITVAADARVAAVVVGRTRWGWWRARWGWWRTWWGWWRTRRWLWRTRRWFCRRGGGGFAGRGGGLGIGTRSLQGARVGGLRGGARSRGGSGVPFRPRAQASRRRGSAAPAIDLPPPQPEILAWRARICAAPTWGAGCSAIAPSAMWLCDRTSLRPGSRADSSVRAGRGGAAVSSSAGSDRCSGPTPITTSSITCIGLTPMTTSGPMPTTMSITASMAVMPMPAA